MTVQRRSLFVTHISEFNQRSANSSSRPRWRSSQDDIKRLGAGEAKTRRAAFTLRASRGGVTAGVVRCVNVRGSFTRWASHNASP